MDADGADPHELQRETVPRERPRHPIVLAADTALGTAAGAGRFGLRAASVGMAAGTVVVRFVALLPAMRSVAGVADQALRPLSDDGRRLRSDTGDALITRAQRIIEDVAPGVIEALDVNSLAERVDIDQLVSRIAIDRVVSDIDIDTLVSRIDIDRVVSEIDIDTLVSRIDIDQLVSRIAIDRVVSEIQIEALVNRIDLDRVIGEIDIDAIVDRIDVEAILDRIDVNEVVQRVDMDAVVEQTELGTIVARSTSGVASETLDAARSQAITVDDAVTRVINRVLRRRPEDLPRGPGLLVPPAGPQGDEEPPA